MDGWMDGWKDRQTDRQQHNNKETESELKPEGNYSSRIQPTQRSVVTNRQTDRQTDTTRFTTWHGTVLALRLVCLIMKDMRRNGTALTEYLMTSIALQTNFSFSQYVHLTNKQTQKLADILSSHSVPNGASNNATAKHMQNNPTSATYQTAVNTNCLTL
jgi:hypothetical protein